MGWSQAVFCYVENVGAEEFQAVDDFMLNDEDAEGKRGDQTGKDDDPNDE